MITVYTLVYNEEILIQFMIDHYRERFPDCHIVIYDNSSTDKTVEIARQNGCEIRTYDSKNSLDDGLHMRIKNSCWKDAKTDWVLMCDLDELLDITQDELLYEESVGTTIIKAAGWTMINLGNDLNFKEFKHGMRDPGYDKNMLFNKKHIKEINYGVGSHSCNAIGNVKFGSKQYIMYHYRDIHPDIAVQHAKTTAARLSVDNKRFKWGVQCTRGEKEIRDDYERLRSIAIEVPQRNKLPMLTVYTVTYNEANIMKFMIDHYRDRFPNCHIVVYDNQSTDNTVEIAEANGCEVRYSHNSGGKHDDGLLWKTKNSCWKDAKTDWVLVCDTDELLDITEEELLIEQSFGSTKIKTECWQMVNMVDNFDYHSIKHGFQYRHSNGDLNIVYDKDLLFNKKYIKEIGYEGAGCHSTNSIGEVVNSRRRYRILHYKYVNADFYIAKLKSNWSRISDYNLKYNIGITYDPNEKTMRAEFAEVRKLATTLPPSADCREPGEPYKRDK